MTKVRSGNELEGPVTAGNRNSTAHHTPSAQFPRSSRSLQLVSPGRRRLPERLSSPPEERFDMHSTITRLTVPFAAALALTACSSSRVTTASPPVKGPTPVVVQQPTAQQ